MTIRSFLVLGLSLVLGLDIFGFQIGRAVKTGREFDRYLSVNKGVGSLKGSVPSICALESEKNGS